MKNILLSIAIPTFNRAEWLQLCLTQLLPQLDDVDGEVEITVYDNASPDDTENIAKSFLEANVPLSYHRNDENIGSDKNIAQCFNKAIGRYVLILGDDDIILDKGLKKLIEILKNHDYGAIYMRAYGYDNDFIKEQPFQLCHRSKIYLNADEFMCKCSSGMAFISSLIINKSKIASIDADQFVGTALVQTYLFYEAVRSTPENLFIDEYLIAAKRIEQRDYNVTQVFGSALNDALDYFVTRGFSSSAVKTINRKLLWYFFPFFLMQLRSEQSAIGAADLAYAELKHRYHQEILFWLCSAPILKMPLKLALFWGSIVIVCSRIINGEFGRLFLALNRRLFGF